MAEHEQGTMKIVEQQKTFRGFVKFWKYLLYAVIVVLVFLAITST